MEQLISFFQMELWVILSSFTFVVAYKLLTGRINMVGLLDDKMTGEPSPGRVQLLVFTVTGAGYYFLLAIEQATSGSLPEVPPELLLAVVGSHVVYLGGKTRSHLFD